MIIVENSSIVNWDDYPEYVCAIVIQTTKDLNAENGFSSPAGEEITWLCDKSPKIVGDDIFLENANLNCLGGLGFRGLIPNIDFPAELKEIHFKPKPVIKIEGKQEYYA